MASQKSYTYQDAYDLYQQGDYKTAKAILLAVTKKYPTHPGALTILGAIAAFSNDYKTALRYYDTLIQHYPDKADAYNNKASVYLLQKAYTKAKELLEAVAKRFDNSVLYSNLGTAYSGLYDDEHATRAFEHALTLDPRNDEAHYGLALIYSQHPQHYTAAKKHFHQAIQINPKHPHADINLAYHYLKYGRYQKGFELFRCRYAPHKKGLSRHLMAERILQKGTLVQGKTLFIYEEQGFGDTLQFIRFVGSFLAQGAKIICMVRTPLIKLLSHNYPQVEFIDKNAFNGDVRFSYHMLLIDAAYLLAIKSHTVPFRSGYLKIDPNDHKKLPSSKKKIGFVYRGNSEFGNDEQRSIPLKQFYAHLQSHKERFDFFSFQLDPSAQELAFMKQHAITTLHKKLHNFYDTAAYAADMNMILTVDTAMAHLCGAMAKKTIVLTYYRQDWRWWGDHRWYESVAVCKQERPEDWESAFEKVDRMLSACKSGLC